MLFKVVFLVSLLGLCYCYDKERIRSMLDAMSSAMYKRKMLDTQLDSKTIENLEEIQKSFAYFGIIPEDVKHDFASVLSVVPGIFSNGDRKRWTTLNFAYQLA